MVDVGRQWRGLQDARDVEPLVTEPDPLIGVDAVDAQLRGGSRAGHRDRLADHSLSQLPRAMPV